MAKDQNLQNSDREVISKILEAWAETTRKGQLDLILVNHDKDALIYDVLSPMKYEGAETYRQSWEEWHPETPNEGRFELEDLAITAGEDVAFAHSFIRCGGTAPNGTVFSDIVRATFCLRKSKGLWKIHHHHISNRSLSNQAEFGGPRALPLNCK